MLDGLDIEESRHEETVERAVLLLEILELARQNRRALVANLRISRANPPDGVGHGRPGEYIPGPCECVGQRGNRRAPNPLHHPREFVRDVVVVRQLETELDQRIDRLHGSELSERSPRVHRRPAFLWIGRLVEPRICHHCNQRRDVIATDTQGCVVSPGAVLGPVLSKREELRDGRRVGRCGLVHAEKLPKRTPGGQCRDGAKPRVLAARIDCDSFLKAERMAVSTPSPVSLSSTVAADVTSGRLTVASIAVICYFVAMLAHEGLGHAVTTVLLGGHVEQITSASCSCDTSGLSPWAGRAVFAGGCVANVVTGFVALWIGSLLGRDRVLQRYAAWLFGHLSLFIAAGYLMVFPFLPAGDWHDFVAGLRAPLIWKAGLTLLGIAGYVATMSHTRRGLEGFLGADPRGRRVRARYLTLMPYLIGGTLETLSSVVGGGGILTFISAAPATFGGTIGVPFVGVQAAKAPAADQAQVPPMLPRTPVVVVVAVLVAIVQLFWLGPGLLHRL